MGAKVEGESYMPGYYAMKDLNVDAGSWSPYYEENTSNGQLFNGFMPNPLHGYSDYDKEMLKRSMLEHEAIFRQQVYELHRVYKIQRELMKECKNKEIYTYPVPADASQTSSLSSQIPPESSKKIQQMQMPLVATAYGKAPVMGPNDMNQPLKFLREGSVQSSPKGFPSSDAAPKSKKSIFDLHLPADCYIDDENASENKPIDFLGVTSNSKPQNQAELTLVSTECPRRLGENNSFSGLLTTNSLRDRQVADLNEPITGMYFDRTNDSASRGLAVPKPYTLENTWRQPVTRASTNYLGSPAGYSRDRHANEGTSSNFFDANNRIRQAEKLVIDKDNGKWNGNTNFFTPRYCDADLQKSFKGTDRRFIRRNQFLYQGQNNSVEWFSRSSLESSAINNFTRSDCSHHSSLLPTAPFSIPQIDHASVSSPLGSFTVDPRNGINNTSAFQSIPCFNASSTTNSFTSPNAVTQSIGMLSHKLKSIENLNGFYPGFPLDSVSQSHPRNRVAISSDMEQSNGLQCVNNKGKKNFNLNEALSDDFEDDLEAQEGRCTGENKKCEGLLSGNTGLKNGPTCADFTGLEKSGKACGYSNGVVIGMGNNKDGKEAALVVHNLLDSALTSRGCGIKKDEASEDVTARSLGVSVCNKIQESATILPLSFHKPMFMGRLAAEGIEKNGTLVRNLIDLNDKVPNDDNSESSVVSHDCRTSSLPNGCAKRTFEIDLEAPVYEEDCALTHQECVPLSKLDVLQESDDAFDVASVAAAKNMVAMSTHVLTTTEKADDTLQWFAELAASNIDDHAELVEVQDYNNRNSSDDGSDSFESLTLRLEETKSDEYWSRPMAPEIMTDELTVSAALLLTKPRRGQQRRRRQKRDFQRDILPGLASLSRHEVTEDIQLLDGLVRASGGSWQMGLGRRGRNGGRAQGRKPKKAVGVTIEEEIPVSPPAKPGTANLEADDKGMIGWGRTTRRCRRPRCPPANNNIVAS